MIMDALWHRPLLEQDYAIINPLQVDSALWDDLPTSVIAPPLLEASRGLMPRLVLLKALSEHRRLSLLERVAVQSRRSPRTPYFSALLASQLHADQLLQRLSRRMIVRGPNGRTGLFRYFDARVFRHLGWILTQPQLDFLMLGIDCWTWSSEGVKWRQARPRGGTAVRNLVLSESQWGHLQRVGLINNCMRNLGISEASHGTGVSIAISISKLLQDSYELHGLTQAADRCRYVEQEIRSIQGQLQKQGP